MLFTTETIVISIINILLLFFASIGFYLSLKIALYWDSNKTTKTQYDLEKKNYLSSTILRYVLVVKVVLLMFFIFSLDKISILIKGAMCVVGVLEGTEIGNYLLIFKIINIYLFSMWILLDFLDFKTKNFKFSKIKSYLYIFIYFPFLLEIVGDFILLSQIDIYKIASCCGIVYNINSSNLMFYIHSLSNKTIVSIFYGNFILICLAYLIKNRFIFAFANFIFVFVAILSLIMFFGTYIYEMPTHYCPFCMMQKEYNYIGYFLYLFLFLGTFFGISSLFLKSNLMYKRYSLIFNLIYTTTISFYPLAFWMKNGVWL